MVYFAIDQDENVAFITKKKTRKYGNVHAHPQVMLTCFEATTQTTVSVTGIAEEVEESFDINAIAGAIMSASLRTTEAATPPITKVKAGEFAAFIIKPAQLHMVIYNTSANKGYHELLETVESFELLP